MNEKILEWFTEKYGLGNLINKNIISIFAIGFFLTLYTASKNGIYLSATLNILTAQPLDFTNKSTKIYNLPLSIYAFSIISGIFLPRISLFFSKKYFLYICTTEANKEKIKAILSGESFIKSSTNELEFFRKISFLSKELDARRRMVNKTITLYTIISSIGAILIISFIFGNILDLLIGISFILPSLLLLHNSVRIFISKVTPCYSVYNKYTSELDEISKI